MELKLKKPIVFFDLETTGINVASDRIVEISILKIEPNGNKETKTMRINPTIPISKEAYRVHGISQEDLKDCPTFADVAQQIAEFIKGCDLAGYNSTKFDIPLLAEEFLRVDVDIDLKKNKFVDVQVIFFKKEQRTLGAAYQFYCDKTLENAHSAEADTLATYEILKSQLDRYEDIKNDIDSLASFTTQSNNVDFAGRFVYKDGVEVFNFGKHKGKPVSEVLENEPGYYAWMMKGDFPLYTKKVLTAIKLRTAFDNVK